MSNRRQKEFEDRFVNDFRNGKTSVFIIVYECEPGSHPVIILTNQSRFGPGILTIPAWLSRGKAERFLQSAEGALRSNTIIEVRHSELQKMIEERRYDPHYSPVLDYHLDIEAEQEEIDAFLGSE